MKSTLSGVFLWNMKFPQAEEVGEVGATGNKSGNGLVQAPSLGGGLDWGEV